MVSQEAHCPICGKHNCVNMITPLNYCMWCGYSFKAEREAKKAAAQNTANSSNIGAEGEKIIVDKFSGQTSLFDVNNYKKKVWRDL